MSKIISFCNQKGGVGKSTLLMLTAIAVHNRLNKKILVIDADLQKSIRDLRNQERSDRSYDLINFNWVQENPDKQFERVIEMYRESYEYIFIDMPGKIRGNEIQQTLLHSDIIIIPIVASILDINATVDFLGMLRKCEKMRSQKGKKPLEVFGVINKKDKSKEYKRLQPLIDDWELNMFSSSISYKTEYKRKLSTYQEKFDSAEQHEINDYFDEFKMRCLS